MRQLILYLAISCIFQACKHDSQEVINFFDPNNYYNVRGSRDVISDSTYHMMLKRYLLAINEESFLLNKNYDYYIIYYHKSFLHIPIIQVVKSINGTIIMSEKQLHGSFKKLLSDTSDFNLLSKGDYIEDNSRFVSFNLVAKYKSILDSCVHFVHSFEQTGFDDDISVIYYFDGKKYYVFSNGYLNTILINRIDSVFMDGNENIPEATLEEKTTK